MSYDDERRRSWSAANDKRRQQRAPGDVWRETITTTGTNLVETVKSIIREGNVTRIIIRQESKVLLDMPIALGAVGVVGALALIPAAPIILAVTAIAGWATHCTIEVERIQR